MKVLGVSGPVDSERSALVDRLAARLDEAGRVAVVSMQPSSSGVGEGGPGSSTKDDGETLSGAGSWPAVRTTFEVAADGTWTATGRGATLDDILDRIAGAHDYVIVDGYDGDVFPRVVLGTEEDSESRPFAVCDSAEDVDVEAVAERLAHVEPFETLESLVARIKRSPEADRAGAIATFTGRVRAKDSPDDAPTEYLQFEKYDGIADQRLETLREELTARDGVFAVELHHRTGVVEAGEDIVFVVVLAGHRSAAFATVEDGIDRLKDEVPLFKKEVTVDDEFWAHDRPD